MRQQVTDEGDARQYWTQVPNIVFDIGLNYQELALYLHMKRAAGAHGKCFKSVRTLARECGMSPTIVVRSKTILQQSRKELSGKPLIAVKERVNPNGGKPFHEITITDIWRQNTNRYAPAEQVPDIALETLKQVPRDAEPSTIEHVKQVPDMERKNNVREEELREEKQNPSAHAELMNFLSTKIGHIPNGGQQGKAVKWLLERYDPVECFGCFNFLTGQAWRSTPVTWTTVQSNIGAWIARMPMGAPNGRAATTTPIPLPKGVCLWGCECGFSVVQNGSGVKQCPECKLQLSEI